MLYGAVPLRGSREKAQDRTVHIELDGILRQVSAQYHRVGLLAGRLVTERIFRAEDPVLGECPVPVPMGLYHPTEQTDPRLIVIDDHGHQWVMSFRAQHNLQRFKITGFAEEDTK